MEVLPLGSSHALSNGNELEELTALLAAFESLNRVELMLTWCLRPWKEERRLQVCLSAWPESRVDTVLGPSDYRSVICWGHEYKSLMGAATTLLYKMDFELAEAEWAKLNHKL